jgi:uncharacterized OsmC-like protein
VDLIRITRSRGLEFDVRVRDRKVTSDMAPADGGRGEGFTPLELVAGAAGACIAMAVQRWCEACDHPGDVEVSVAFELRDDPKRMAALVVDLELPPGLPESRRRALRRVVEECPIRETLRRPPRVDVELVFNQQETRDRLRPVP